MFLREKIPGKSRLFEGFALGFLFSRLPLVCRLYNVDHMIYVVLQLGG